LPMSLYDNLGIFGCFYVQVVTPDHIDIADDIEFILPAQM